MVSFLVSNVVFSVKVQHVEDLWEDFSEYWTLGGKIYKQCTVSSSLKVEYPPGLKGEKAAPHYDLNRAGRSIEQKAEKI